MEAVTSLFQRLLFTSLLPPYARKVLAVLRRPLYTTAVQAVCIASSVFLILSGVPEMRGIVRRRSSAHRSLAPFIAMAVDTVVGFWFCLLVGDSVGTPLRGLSLVVTSCYLAIMVAYSADRRRSGAVVATALAGLAVACLALALYVPRGRWIDVLGSVNTLTAIAFAASPLADIGKVLKTRDASSLPFAMVSVLSVCALSWGIYGTILGNVRGRRRRRIKF